MSADGSGYGLPSGGAAGVDLRGHLVRRAFPDEMPSSCFVTDLGILFSGDCLDVLANIGDGVVDTVFADPPFNIGKAYGNGFDDSRNPDDYLAWCRTWLDECIRVTRDGGALFVFNIPRWNIPIGAHLMSKGMTFRHDIAVEMKNSFPISGRLYPSHYSLLYFTKGKPRTFRKIRTPIPKCRHCGGEIPDYGGHRSKMNPLGVNLTDMWTDIPVVRHRKYKPSGRGANTLSTKILDRVITMTTVPGDLVLDPFGGAGTTFAVAEKHGRAWIGIELNDSAVIVERLSGTAVCHHGNDDFVESD